MSSSGGVEAKLYVGIFTPAFSYPASLPYASVVKAALAELELQEEDCEFLKQDNDKIACVIKNNKFTLQYVEETYAQNKQLLEHLERAAEGLQAFHNKLNEDAELIRDLKQQLHSANAAWELKYKEEHNLRMVLKGRLEQLKIVVNSDISDSTEPSKPKIPKLQLGMMNGIANGRESTEKIPPLMISELRNGVKSPRHSPTCDTHHVEAPRFALASPRENAHSPVPQIMNINGKRSISSSNLLVNGDTPPQVNGKHATQGGVCNNEPSPRATLSPRGVAQTSPRPASSSPRTASHAHASITSIPGGHIKHVKEHLRRHSTNFGSLGGINLEDLGNRRHSSNSEGKSPRSKSSSEIPPQYFDLTQQEVHSMPVTHSFSYGSSDAFSKRKSVVVHIKSRSEAQIDVPAETLSQKNNKKLNGVRKPIQRAPSLLTFRKVESKILRSSSSLSLQQLATGKKGENDKCNTLNDDLACRLCNCSKFRVTNKEWMCSCGHANIKHAVFLKASPAQSPTVSPRKL